MMNSTCSGDCEALHEDHAEPNSAIKHSIAWAIIVVSAVNCRTVIKLALKSALLPKLILSLQ